MALRHERAWCCACSTFCSCPLAPLAPHVPPAQLATIPGAKGMQELLHHIPTWISFRETERMEVRGGRGGPAWHGTRRSACYAPAHACAPVVTTACRPTRMRAQWLNRILEKAWPYYDEAICKMVKVRCKPGTARVAQWGSGAPSSQHPVLRGWPVVVGAAACGGSPFCCRRSRRLLSRPLACAQEQVEPLMMQYKPPGLIKKIYFQKLTFGDDPFRCAWAGGLLDRRARRDSGTCLPGAASRALHMRARGPACTRRVEGIRVDRENKDEVCIEVRAARGVLPRLNDRRHDAAGPGRVPRHVSLHPSCWPTHPCRAGGLPLGGRRQHLPGH